MLGRPLGVGGQAVIVLSLVLRVLPMLMHVAAGQAIAELPSWDFLRRADRQYIC
jgi:hypothetical protein